MNSYDNKATDHLDDGISSPTTKPSGPPVVAHQVYKVVEGRSYPSSLIDWRGHRYDFARPTTAREALGELVMFQLDKGEHDGLTEWERRNIDGDETVDVPGGYPELKFYVSNGLKTVAYIIAPCGKGKFSDPLNKRGWQVKPVEAALPCGWKPSAEFVGHLPACLRYAARTHQLELDCPSVVYTGLDRDMIKALMGALR